MKGAEINGKQSNLGIGKHQCQGISGRASIDERSGDDLHDEDGQDVHGNYRMKAEKDTVPNKIN